MEQYYTDRDILLQIEKNSRRQARFALIQCVVSCLCLLCCGLALFSILSLVPKMERLVNQADTALEDLGQVAQQLAQVDYAALTGGLGELVTGVETLVENADQLIGNANQLIVSSQKSMDDAMSRINSIDFEGLNKAIQNLADVVEPLASFFNSLR